MTDNELLLAIYKELQSLKHDNARINEKLDVLEQQIKSTERTLKNEIRKEAGLVLDEVERVHGILDQHKEDKSVHTA